MAKPIDPPTGGLKLPFAYEFAPLTVSLETLGGVATPLVLMGTPLPAKRTQVFSTAADNQESVEIKVFIGASPMADRNTLLGRVELRGLRKAQRGAPQIEVTFEVSRHLRVSVQAIELLSKLKIDATLEGSEVELSPLKVEEMLVTANESREEDDRTLQNVEARNDARNVLARAEQVLIEQNGRLSAPLRTGIEQAVADSGKSLQGSDIYEIRRATERLKGMLPVTATPQFDFGSIFDGPFQGSSFGQNRARSPSSQAVESTGRVASDVAPRARSFDLGRVFGGGSFTLDPTLCFVLMPFSGEMRPVYEDHVKLVVEALGLTCTRADEILGGGPITSDIWEKICRSRVIVADLSGRNPNVFYELGIAHALGKDVVLLSQGTTDLPFDIRNLRCISYAYTPRGMKELESQLKATIEGLLRAG